MKVLQSGGIVVAIIVALAASALLYDAALGLPFSRAARTWGGWAAGLILLGAVYVIAEGAFQWATERDRTTDPLHRRVFRLMLGWLRRVVLCGCGGGSIRRSREVWSRE